MHINRIATSMVLRVLNLTEEGRWGGPQARITLIAEHLQTAGIETLVVAPSRDSQEFHRRLHQAGIKHRLLNIHRLTKEKSILLRYFVFFVPELIQLLHLLDNEAIDIIYCNGAWQIKGVLAGWLKNKKIVWHLNDTRKTTMLHMIFGILSKCVNGFIFTSNAARQCYLPQSSHYRDKPICEIQAPVDTKYFDPDSVSPAFDLAGSDSLTILTIGNISPGKGIDHFIDMAHVLAQKGQAVDFLIAGAHFASQRRYIEHIKEKIRHYGLGNIRFLGSRVDIASVLKAADIFVCASISESGPMSVWEAMSMGKPIVSTDVGDVAHYIQDGENGFIVPIGNPAALAEKVEILMGNPELRTRFGKLAREVAVRNLDVQIAAQKHESFYRLLVGNDGLQGKAAQ